MSAVGRREQVGDAGIRLVARDGIRALTHLRVDAEADLPRGSTSYYARTRHDLLRLVVNRLSERSRDDAQIDVPAGMTRIEAADFLTRLVDRLARRPIDLTARTALVVELRDDAELRDVLTVDAPWRKRLAHVPGLPRRPAQRQDDPSGLLRRTRLRRAAAGSASRPGLTNPRGSLTQMATALSR